jgi:phosphatidylserine/phosphatidylglycerophosphate/cardiolipin synthase-like enzyme
MVNKVIVVAIVCLVIGVGLGYLVSSNQIIALQSEIDRLDSELTTVSNDYAQLSTTYNDLHQAYTQLEQQVQYNIEVLTNQDYYDAVRDDFQRANETIYVAMYSMKYDPADSDDWANDLIRDLVYAHNRGIDVYVLVENRTFFGFMEDNQATFQYLISNGVNVTIDNENDTDHMKLVIIDEYIVYVGSHNWSESALYYNHETSVKIVSSEIATVFKNYFPTI